jgi:putative transposase
MDKNLSLEIKPNAIYSKKDVFKPLIRAQAESTTIESACRRSGMISSDGVFYHLNKLSIGDVTDLLRENVEDIFTSLRKKNRITGRVDIAIDVHEMPYHGKGLDIFVLGGKQKSGTNKFFKVITLCIVCKGKRYTLAVIPISFFDITAKLLEQLVEAAKAYVKIRYVFLDRGFLSVDSVNKLDELLMQFIIPIKRSDKIVNLMGKCFLDGIGRTKYTMRSGNRETTFDLAIYETDGDLVGFATNISGSPERIALLYRKRWGIETSYRVKNTFFGRTCSRKPAIRVLFIMMSFLLYNLWVLANSLLQKGRHVTAGDMGIEFVKLIENGIP